MKNLLALLLVAVTAYCVTGQGIPIANCPPGEHSVLYCPRQAEPSCDNPKVHDPPNGVFGACDIPDCFCDVPTLRDVKTNKCVLLSECS